MACILHKIAEYLIEIFRWIGGFFGEYQFLADLYKAPSLTSKKKSFASQSPDLLEKIWKVQAKLTFWKIS